MTIIKQIAGLAAAGALLGFGSVASAIVCNDPLPAGETRQIEFTVDSGTVSCYDSGTGNPGDNDWPDFLEKDEGNSNGGYMSHDGFGGGSSGGFTITGLTDFLLLLKFGGGGGRGGDAANEPDWFLLSVTGATSPVTGSWSWELGNATGLSHASLYGEPSRDVPEPGTLALLGLGLMGLGLARRRKA